MTTPVGTRSSASWLAIVGWGVLAALLGLLCMVVPTLLLPEAVDGGYESDLFPWFMNAFNNLQFGPTVGGMFVVGVIVGYGQPRWWPLSACMTVSLLLFLDAISVAHNPGSHNLFPLEFAFLIFLGLTALAGGLLGCLVRVAVQRGRTKRGN